jgi:predicted nucleic acid-binding protein
MKKSLNIFIDTNIYLTFYHYTGEDLEELKKLSVAIKSKDIKLYVTEQVKNEFRRNREAKIADALKRFSEQNLSSQFPQMCKEYEEYKHLRAAIRQYEETKDKILQKLRSDAEQSSLGADEVISELFSGAETLVSNEKVLAAATMRMKLGNPPGKNGSYGDAINWETLLAKTPNEDLYLVTEDKDYISPVSENRLCQFLEEEWQAKKSKIFFYRKLSHFFRDKFPRIKIASELEKELAIVNLVNSGKFETTHSAISRLSKFTDFTNIQVSEIVDAAISNSQIFWIWRDPDVKNFMQTVIKGKETAIEPEKLAKFKEIYFPSEFDASNVAKEEIEF